MTPPLTVQPGDVLAGKYVVERVIGTGGIGVVVAARHQALDRLVALKFLLPGYDTAPAALERFHREARAAAKLRSDHAAQVLDVGVLETGAPYIVMEYLEGTDLSRLVTYGPLSVPEAVDYVLQACEAIGEAHAAGIVHRDLKPANLFRTTAPDGTWHVKVLDFGIAKMNAQTAGSDHALTSTRGIMGSPLYMSPEQLESARHVDGRSDVWSLGAILYELVTGSPPFVEETLARLCVTILQHEPRRPSELAPHVHPAFDAVLLRCLQKRRGDRYQTVAELANALAPFAPSHAMERIRRIERLGQPRLADSQTGPRGSGPPGLAETLPSDAREAETMIAPAVLPSAVRDTRDASWESSQFPADAASRRRIWPIVAAALGGATIAALAVGGLLLATRSGTPAEPAASISAQPAPAPSSHEAPPAPSSAPALSADPPAPAPAPSASAPPPKRIPPPAGAARPRPAATGTTKKKPDLLSDRE
jgi:serine/threonine-protein kinase